VISYDLIVQLQYVDLFAVMKIQHPYQFHPEHLPCFLTRTTIMAIDHHNQKTVDTTAFYKDASAVRRVPKKNHSQEEI
jgi:hypothetical protein